MLNFVPKFVKYIKMVLELVRACKYCASRIRVYALPMWHASMATVCMSMSESILFTDNSLGFIQLHINVWHTNVDR